MAPHAAQLAQRPGVRSLGLVRGHAAIIAARYGSTGLLVAETLAAGLTHGAELWFATPANVARLLSRAADEMGIAVHIATTWAPRFR
jgi:hypothetical protein